ncbi:TPA: hypothetical protein U5D40_002901 [Yersinia enterocolitica]|nr:hypothetical protein [Yersinia enterocolitica]
MIAIALVEGLTTELEQVIQDQNWQQISKMNLHISQLLTSIAGVALSQPQLVAIERLKKAYRRAYECCALQKKQLKAEMQNTRNQQDGITAYAMMAITAYQHMAQHEGTR